MKGKALTLMAGVAMVAGGVYLLFPFSRTAEGGEQDSAVAETSQEIPEAPKDRVESIEIPPKATYGVLMEEQGVGSTDATAVYEAAKDFYDLATIRAGKRLELAFDAATGDFKSLMYPISTEEELRVRKEDGVWKAAKEAISYEIKLKTVRGTVTSSLYAAGLEQGMDERAVIEMGDAFQWSIDFAQDVRVGDSFVVVYEERYRDGAYAMPGLVLAARYVNDGTTHNAYWFENAAGEGGYYDEKGNSQRKMFLKAPVAFKYITSGFTTGLRYVAAFNTSTGHRAIDYAAAQGTPIRATADGVVSFAGWDGPYGNKVSIRHNGTYTTNYAHQSKLAVKRGQRVSQGQVIGYVGSTGFSTGPHLHYEMVKNGTKINPMKETFPGTDPIKPEEKEAYEVVVQKWSEALR
ncbi:MAG: peptidoglycan DD-metalloendopeptidase family protein [Patescibacteria group bacterium]|nr:MAG: peptidoglycan DD-metalloendopeptidase family protein [Patescibacteria group bacterium]